LHQGRFDPYKTHGGAPDSLADRLGVTGIILVTPSILRRHQTHLMAKLRQFVRPIVRCGQASMPMRHSGSALKNAITWLRRSCLLTATFSHQDRGFSTVRGYRLHRDMKGFSV